VLSEDTLRRARAGDENAFQELVEPYRRELQLHCYRILGSLQDAEDQLQETLLAAWRGLDGFEGRASLRAWLYRIATNRCLNALRDRRHRPQEVSRMAEPPEPTRRVEPSWLEPYPDVLLEGLADTAPGPEARYETAEAVGLAFAAAVERGDTDGVVSLLTDDAWLTMPPEPYEYQGGEAIARFLQDREIRRGAPLRLVPTRANGQPAFGCYLPDAQAAIARAYGLMVLTLEGERISAITWFGERSLLAHFGLPRTLPD
jgi:RNA polymerase sigma-70 factor (ECF subfamily)